MLQDVWRALCLADWKRSDTLWWLPGKWRLETFTTDFGFSVFSLGQQKEKRSRFFFCQKRIFQQSKLFTSLHWELFLKQCEGSLSDCQYSQSVGFSWMLNYFANWQKRKCFDLFQSFWTTLTEPAIVLLLMICGIPRYSKAFANRHDSVPISCPHYYPLWPSPVQTQKKGLSQIR